MRKPVLFLLIPFFASSQLFSQTLISGTVQDNSGTPLSFANVLLRQLPDSTLAAGTVSGENGSFSVTVPGQGQFFLQLTMAGFADYFSDSFDTGSSSPKSFEIILQQADVTLEEVELVAKKPLFEQQIDRMVVNVQNSIMADGTDVLTILERSPGIEIDRLNNQIRMMGKQGVLVMLDGKMMQMDAAGLISLLQSMPSDNIRTIELITTPPASFDAEGDAGIINIVTKKSESEGYFSTLNLNSGYGVKPKFGGSFNLNYRKNKFSLLADFSGNHNFSQEDVTISRSNTFENIITQTELFSDRPTETGLYNFRLGMDYRISPRTTIGILSSGYLRRWVMDATTETNVSDNFGTAFTSLLSAGERNNWRHLLGNLSLQHEFADSSQLTLNFDYLDFFDENPTDYEDRIFDGAQTLTDSSNFISRKSTPITFKVFKADYAKTFSKVWKLEAGIKGTQTSFVNDLRLATLEDGIFTDDQRFTDVFRLDEVLGAVYSSVDYNPKGPFSAKFGLRYEYYDSDLTSEREGDILLQQFGRIFPTAFLSYRINEKQNLQLTYSRRITRPSIQDIAPAFYFWGFNTVLGGNPDIQPTFSDRLNLSYRISSFMLQFQYADDKNAFAFQPVTFPEENLIVTRAVNMPDSKSAMLSLSFPLNFTDWWESRYNISGLWGRFQPVFEEEVVPVTNWSFFANMTQNFRLPADFSFEVSGRISSPARYGLGEFPLRGTFGLGLKKAFSPNSSLTLNWSDPFNVGSFWAATFDQPELNLFYDWFYDREGSIFRLNYSYTFGNNSLKKWKDRSTASEEERQRVN